MTDSGTISFDAEYGEEIDRLFQGLLDNLEEIDNALYSNLESIEDMQSKYIESKFDDLTKIKENLDDIRNAVDDYKMANLDICGNMSDADQVFNRGF